MTQLDILKYRLHNQQIGGTKFKKPGEVVAWLGAVQAQDFSGAKWAIGLRVNGLNDAAVEQAFSEGKILRTHVLRPTWHFVAPQDIRWMLALTSARVNAMNAYHYRKLELDYKIFERSNKILTKALKGGKQLTRQKLMSVLQQANFATDDLRFAHLIMRAELDGLICSGARQGKQFTYTLLEERVPKARSLKRDEALAKLARRYFTSHGPATLHDFVWWSGLSMTDAKAGLAAVKSNLVHEVVNGREYFFAEISFPENNKFQGTYLLPNYDEFIVAYKDRSALLPSQDITKHVRGGNALFNNTILINGQIAGVWQRTIKKNAVVVERTLFKGLSKTKHQAVMNAAKQYSKFAGKLLEERKS